MDKRNYYIVSLIQYSPWITVKVIKAKDSQEAYEIFDEKYRTNEEYIVLSEVQWKEAYESIVKEREV